MRKNIFNRVLILTLITSIILCLTDELLARAGGGRGYSSGSGGRFSGGSGDGEGIGVLIYFLVQLVVRYPAVGIPVAIIVIAFFVFGSKKGHSAHVSRSIARTYSRHNERKVQVAESRLKERDPKFERNTFNERIKQAFLLVQEAWANQDMKPVRHLISDGVFERFSIQFDIQKASLIRNEMSNVRIMAAEIADIDSDPFFDTIHVKITAMAKDRFIRTDKEKVVFGSESSEPFTEYWSFLRRPGAQSLEKPGLIEGVCPNCGTPLNMADCTECPSCKALINSGEYDWVLAEITQPAEWQQRSVRDVPGLQKMVQKDPAFNTQHIEDKVSVIFYRYIAARFFADSSYLIKMAAPEFIAGKQEQFKPLDNGMHEFYADAAVGTVEVVEVCNSADEGGMDKVRLKVKWAAHQQKARVPSYLPPDYEQNHIYMTDFIVLRQASVKSSDKNVLTSAHCPGCGAPESRNTNGYCEYCQTPLNDGSSGWVLCDIRRFSGYPSASSHYQSLEVGRAPAHALSAFDRESIVCCAIAVMLADGQIDESEKATLLAMVKEYGIDRSRLDILINTVQAGDYHIPEPSGPEEAKCLLKAMVSMCLADGQVTAEERQLINQLGHTLNFSRLDLDQMFKQEKSRLHQQVKAYKKSL